MLPAPMGTPVPRVPARAGKEETRFREARPGNSVMKEG
jgi:hypothetical protein